MCKSNISASYLLFKLEVILEGRSITTFEYIQKGKMDIKWQFQS